MIKTTGFYLNEKKEFIAIDFFKYFAAILVVAIHLPPFGSINTLLSYGFNEVFCRIAVPFFFMCSGFFMVHNLKDKNKFKKYIFHLIKLYLIWTVLNLPVLIISNINANVPLNTAITKFIFNFFVNGSYLQLWYFVALIVAVCLMYLLVNIFKFADYAILIFSSVLYLIGVMGNGYKEIFLQIPIVGSVLQGYLQVFETTRNGLFFGLFFVAIGYFIKKNEEKIKNRKYWLFAGIAMVGMLAEEYMLRNVTHHQGSDMLLMTAVAVPLIFLTVAFVKMPLQYLSVGKLARNVSALLFGAHMIVLYICQFLLVKVLGHWYLDYVWFLLVWLLGTLFAIIIVALSKNKCKWLKHLY